MAAKILKIWREEYRNCKINTKTENSSENKQDKQKNGPIVRLSEVHFGK